MKKFKITNNGIGYDVEAESMQAQSNNTVTFWVGENCVAVFYDASFATEVPNA